jgi:hypothetical protein
MLKAFEGFRAGSGSRTPELYSDRPNLFDYSFVKKFVAHGKF